MTTTKKTSVKKATIKKTSLVKRKTSSTRKKPSASKRLKQKVLKIYSPATGEFIQSVPVSIDAEIKKAISNAKEAFESWSALSVKERAKYVLKAKKYMVDHLEEIVEILHAETGKVRTEVLSHELLGPIDLMNYYAKKAPELLKTKRIKLHAVPFKKSFLKHTPKGVVGIISPWNFPFTIPIGEVVMSLLAGNTVILKPSEITPLSGLLIKEIFDKIGLPSGVFEVIIGDGLVGAQLVESDIQHIVFTGSVRTGRIIAESAAKRFLPVTLELGGKDPMIVLPDANVDKVAKGATFCAFANSGQVCASTERIYVHESMYDEFVEKVKEETLKLRQGAEEESGGQDVGPMIFKNQITTVKKHIRDAEKKGARILTGGDLIKNTKGRFFEPTIITDVNHAMACMKEETFGPTMPIMKYSTIEEAIKLANDSEFGLTASVWGKNKKLLRETANKIQAGTVIINDCIYTHGLSETPWSGIKNSGMGKVHSDMGLFELTNIIHINEPRAFDLHLWWYPYYKTSYNFMKNFIYFNAGTIFQKIKGLLGIIGLKK